MFICLINNKIAGRVAEEGNFAIDCCTKITGAANTIDADELLDNIFSNNGKNFRLKRIKEMKG